MMSYKKVKKYDEMSIHLDTVPALDRQTDRQTDGQNGKTISHYACIAYSACIAC